MVNKVLVCDDQPMMQELIHMYMEEAEDFSIVAAIVNAALAELTCMQIRVDLVLMDVVTQNDESGFEATKRLKKNFPDIKVLIITSMLDFDYIQRAKKVGADGIWFKEVSQQTLLDVMRKIMQGASVFPDKSPELRIGLCSSYQFTPAELRVLRYVVEGFTYKQIADKLRISDQTVKDHVRSMLQKTGFTSKTKLAAEVAAKRFVINGF